MVNYLYDGTAAGLFSCVYEALRSRHRPDHIYDIGTARISLVDEYRFIDTDAGHAGRIYEFVGRRISVLARDMVRIMALSADEDAGIKILDYIREGLDAGYDTDYAYGSRTVMEAWKLRNNVMAECHKYMGFIRFGKIRSDILFAAYAPRNDLNLLLADHFCDRLRNERWMLYDENREKAELYENDRYIEAHIPKGVIDDVKTCDDGLTGLWKGFLDAVAIKERENRKLQFKNMPKRYHKHMVETE